MSSLVLLPSSSLLPSFPYSVHGAAAALPTSPTSSWSPSSSPQSRMQSLCLATSASSPLTPVSAYMLPPSSHSHSSAAASNAVVAHVLSSPAPRVHSGPATAVARSPYSSHTLQAAAATPSFVSAASPTMSPPPAMMSVAGGGSSMASPQLTGGQSLLSAGQSLNPSNTLQAGQTIVFDQNGQAFILSPITNVTPAFQPQQPAQKQQTAVQLQQYASAQYPQASAQSFSGAQLADWQSAAARQGGQHSMAVGSAVSAQSNTIVLSQQPPLYQQAWTGGDSMRIAAAPMNVSQQLYQPLTSNLALPLGSTVHHSHAQPLYLTTAPLHGSNSAVPSLSSASFGSPLASFSAGHSPIPVVSSAFQPLAKRALSANVSPSLLPSLRPLSPAVASLQGGKPASPRFSAVSASGSRTPQRKMSAVAASTPSHRQEEEAEGGDAAALLYSAPSLTRNSSDSGGEQSTSPRIDGLSSSRLLTHVNKKPSHVLPFVIHRSQLPHNFDHLVNSAASSTTQPPTPSGQPPAPPSGSDMVTVNIRVMGGPALADLYFVAADISQLIHSRKSNIAKAVSVFTDDERARCSVVCPRSNNTQSTHILTVLTMAGVRRLLHSSRSTIALPLLAWLQDKVDHIVAQDTTSRPQPHSQQQQQQRGLPLMTSGSKRKSSSGSGARHEDGKEDEGSSDKRTKRE